VWIEYVRVQPGSNTYTVIDAIAAVNPVEEGDALSISPADVAVGTTNLFFQSPANRNQTLIAINLHSVSNAARISTVRLTDFSSFAPVPGNVLYACQATVRPITDATNVALLANIGLSVGSNYSGTGGDLRVLQWNGTNWTSPPFSYDQASREAWVAGLTNLSAFVVAQVSSPALDIQRNANGSHFEFVPFAGFSYTLQRSTDLLSWTALATVTAQSEQPLTIADEAPPPQAAFYRLLVNP
jgi:hypothetical protein